MVKSADWKARPDDPVFQVMREKVLMSASELIKDTGVQGLRLESVARHAGLARSSLYRYFDGKEQLLVELLLYEFNQLSSRMLDTTGQIEDPVVKFIEIVYRSVHVYRTDPHFTMLIGPTNDKTVQLVAFVLEKVPSLITPYLYDYGFYASDEQHVAERKYLSLANWTLHVVYSMGVFGGGAFSREREKAMLADMFIPVLTDQLSAKDREVLYEKIMTTNTPDDSRAS